jgi:predicted polyphosphate/ATP-dependent NAD kinase
VIVGVIANPASGRDIRRLVAGASVFGNADKAGMVLRLLAGLGATGVERVLMMPAGDGLSVTLERQLRARDGTQPLPVLEVLPMMLTGTADDSAQAAEQMCAEGVAAIVVLGGDGTHRVVAQTCGDTPLCALSTGTNNVFPEMRESTVAGLATGLFATGRVGPEIALRRKSALAVSVAGRVEHALVDVAVTPERFVGARALWRAEDVSELFVTHADPGATGLSAIAGLLHPHEHGVHVTLAPPATAELALSVPLAPGLIVPVGIQSSRTLTPNEEVTLDPAAGCLALDGERTLERTPADAATVRIVEGPLTIDVDAVMRQAAHAATLVQPRQA